MSGIPEQLGGGGGAPPPSSGTELRWQNTIITITPDLASLHWLAVTGVPTLLLNRGAPSHVSDLTQPHTTSHSLLQSCILRSEVGSYSFFFQETRLQILDKQLLRPPECLEATAHSDDSLLQGNTFTFYMDEIFISAGARLDINGTTLTRLLTQTAAAEQSQHHHWDLSDFE